MNPLHELKQKAIESGLLRQASPEAPRLIKTTPNSTNYDLIRGIRNSELSYLKKSPLHWKAYQDGRLHESQVFLTGRILHLCILEPDRFYELFAVKENARSKAGKEINAIHEAQGKILISDSDFKQMTGIIESLEKSPEIKDILRRSRIEKVLCWQYNELHCKAKIDLLIPGELLCDFKFIKNAQPDKLPRIADRYDYDRQMAWYLTGAVAHQLATWQTPTCLVCVEKTPPYAYTILDLDYWVIRQGMKKYEALLDKYQATVAQGKYPGYPRSLWELED